MSQENNITIERQGDELVIRANWFNAFELSHALYQSAEDYRKVGNDEMMEYHNDLRQKVSEIADDLPTE